MNCTFILFNVLFAMPLSNKTSEHFITIQNRTIPCEHTQEDIDEIIEIVEEYLNNSALQHPLEDGYMIYKWAKTVHSCRKSCGIVRRKNYHPNSGITTTSSHNDNRTPFSYNHEKNIESEIDVPTWDVSLTILDGVFDQARFDRHLTWEENTSFKRRIPWLYPSNGKFKIRKFEIPFLYQYKNL